MGVGVATFKTGAKRAAFGDVSNIVAVSRPSKDDSTLQSKPVPPAVVKQTQVVEKKSAAFLRPAQRPLSVSNFKSFLGGTNSTSTSELNPKAQPLESIIIAPPNNSRKVLTKRNTTIFKDVPVLEPVPEQHISLLPPTLPEKLLESTTIQEITYPSQDSRLCFLPPVTDIAVEPTKEATEPRSETSLPSIDTVSLDTQPLSSEVNAEVPLDGRIASEIKREVAEICHVSNSISVPSAIITENQAATIPEIETLPSLMPGVRSIRPNDFAAVYAYQPAQVEREEYWDEEEDETYEEDGYVTARSFRSKGDNTTGGGTTVLFPQMNQKARREIAAAKQLVEATRTPEEVEDECYDTSMVAEYGDDIFEYMRQLEVKMLPNAHYMDNQHEIQWSMRAVLMDWLVQVHHRFNLLPETLFLCVNYIDRFLSCKVVSLGKLQLVGATAIFIAAKYEEINCPSVQEIVYMVDGGYTIDEILKAERFMLTMLQFELGWPGPMSFLRRISKADDYDLETRTLAKYFLEVTLMDERFIGSPPSFAAAASHCLARAMLRKGSWVSPYW